MKTISLFIPAFFLIAGIFGAFLWFQGESLPPDPGAKEEKAFLIKKGQSAQMVAKSLKNEGLIRSELAFRILVQFSGKEKAIQAGKYKLSPGLTLGEIVSFLTEAPQEVWVTYPEGLRREEMAVRTIEALALENDTGRIFWDEFLRASKDQEGFLFPDTYLFPHDIGAEVVVRKLTSTFGEKVSEEIISDVSQAGLTLKETVNLASIVERETLTEEERPIVAGILLKRLKNGWPLQADATLQYIVATQRCGSRDVRATFDTCGTSTFDWWEPPTLNVKELASPFNTYKNRGLPPFPIANPGLSSIKAVVYPQDSPYWFYLHDKEGKIHYAKTIEEHAENIGRHLR